MDTIYDIIVNASNKYTNNILLYNEDGVALSYTGFLKQLSIAQKYFGENTGEQTFNFSIISPNCPNYLYILFSLLTKNCTAVNLNPNLTEYELDERLTMANVSVIFTTKSLYPKIKNAVKSNEIHLIYLFDEDSMEFKINDSIQSDLITKSPQQADNLAFLQFTGGTTGTLKAAALTQQNVLSNISQLSAHFEKYNKLKPYTLLITFPFYHIFSIVFNVLFFMHNGSKLILFKDLRNFNFILNTIHQQRVSFIVGVNTWYNKLMQHPSFNTKLTETAEICFAGGEYVPVSTKVKWKKLTGKQLYSAYGLTETCSLTIISPLDDSNTDDAIGIAIPDTEVILLDENNHIMNENNTMGEIALRGMHITNHYYNNRAETSISFSNGYFKTGDIAVKSDKQHFKIVDRKKDMISVSGNKVYPNEIESVLFEINGIMDAAVIGKPSEISGEVVIACVVADRNLVNSDLIYDICKKYLTNYKIPKEIIFLNELPKTAIGKTSRKLLKELIKNSYGN